MPAIYRQVAEDPRPGALLELPIFEGVTFHRNASFVLASTAHWRPLVNGYSGRRPNTFDVDARLLNRLPARRALARVREIGVRYVVVHLNLYRDPGRGRELVGRLDRHGAFVPVATDGPTHLYQVRDPARGR